MRLFQGWLSSASWRVRWALAIKGLAYESVWIDIAAGEQQERLAGINPLRSVPTLELADGEILCESTAIIEWLDELYPARPLLPSDPLQRARVREFVQWVNSGIHPLQNTIVRRAIASEQAEQHAWSARWIERGLRAYELQLDKRRSRFSVGQELSMAELFLVPQVLNAERFGADLADCPRVRAIYELCLALPECQATHPARATEAAQLARQPKTEAAT